MLQEINKEALHLIDLYSNETAKIIQGLLHISGTEISIEDVQAFIADEPVCISRHVAKQIESLLDCFEFTRRFIYNKSNISLAAVEKVLSLFVGRMEFSTLCPPDINIIKEKLNAVNLVEFATNRVSCVIDVLLNECNIRHDEILIICIVVDLAAVTAKANTGYIDYANQELCRDIRLAYTNYNELGRRDNCQIVEAFTYTLHNGDEDFLDI